MNPQMSDAPTQACGSRSAAVPNAAPPSPCSSVTVGARSGRAVAEPSSGPDTRPSPLSNEFSGIATRLHRLWRCWSTASVLGREMPLLATDRLRSSWPCEFPLALYSVSTPSGMITIREVPTRTPVPRAVIRRNCRGERENESGRMPAAKDLRGVRVVLSPLYFSCCSEISHAPPIIVPSKSNVQKPSIILIVRPEAD